MTAEELARFQRETERHLSFSLTLACPLRCAHCMVGTRPAGRREGVTMAPESAAAYATEMPTLAAMGIERISFTGGEPLLAQPQLDLLSRAAAAAGIASTVVTACHWAKDPEAARRLVARFPGVRHWHLSTDYHHARYLDPICVLNAARAALDQGREVVVRMAVARLPGADEWALVEWVRERLPDGAGLALQPITPVGRALEIGVRPETGDTSQPPRAPCPTTGAFVRHDGALMPCCSGLAEWPDRSPFRRVDTIALGLAPAVQTWREDPLLQLVRAIGFAFPAAWAETALGRPAVSPSPRHPCDFCVALWAEADAREAARQAVEFPGAREKIADLAAILFAGDDVVCREDRP